MYEMKKLMKVTAVLSIIFGVHYLILAIISLLATGIAAFASLATFSLPIIGGTFGLILILVLYLGLTIIYGLGGIWTLKEKKKNALLCMIIAIISSLIALVIAIVSPSVKITFSSVMALILPVVNVYLIIQTTE